MNDETMITVENLKVHFVTWKGVVKALDGVTFEIRKNETLGLVGETGCGKSVTSLSIMNLIPPTDGTVVEGHIYFENIDMTNPLVNMKKPDVWLKYGRKGKVKLKYNRRRYVKRQEFVNKIRGKKIAMIFQEPMTALNPVLKIGYQLTEPLIYHSKNDLAMRILSRIDINNANFSDMVDAVLNNKEDKIKSYLEDPKLKPLMEQLRSIMFRKDLTRLQKSERMNNIRNDKPLNSLERKYLEELVENNGHERFFWRLPIIHRIVFKRITMEAERKAMELLNLVNIYNADIILKEYPHELSGGMRQRVMIAMALANDPKLLIADEPTTALDVTTQAQILDLMKDLKYRIGSSILFITHDLGVIADIADRVAVMYAGNIVEIGPKDDIFYKPKHPYTQGLLKSIPTNKTMKEKLHVIPGSIPNLVNPPAGCRFHPRCPHAMEICTREKPVMKEIEKDHYVACWLY
ncbi:MAG: ABC transporter ATP-binding protein [Thermoplasmata archaeon]